MDYFAHESTYIDNGCKIGKGTKIWHFSHILSNTKIGENCNIGAGTIVANLRFDNNTVKVRIRNNQVDTGRRKLGVMMGDEVQTGVGVNIMPGIKVGQKTWISPNTTVYQDTEEGTFLIQEQRLRYLKSRKKQLRNQ